MHQITSATEWRGVRTSLLVMGLSLALLVAVGGTALGAIRVVKTVDGNQWQPKTKSIARNDSIKWKNADNVTHNVKAIDLKKDWNFFETLSPGETVKRKFGKTGNYQYRCTLHSSVSGGQCNGMCGVIRVQSP